MKHAISTLSMATLLLASGAHAGFDLFQFTSTTTGISPITNQAYEYGVMGQFVGKANGNLVTDISHLTLSLQTNNQPYVEDSGFTYIQPFPWGPNQATLSFDGTQNSFIFLSNNGLLVEYSWEPTVLFDSFLASRFPGYVSLYSLETTRALYTTLFSPYKLTTTTWDMSYLGTVPTVPEPESWALLLGGLAVAAGIAGLRRKGWGSPASTVAIA